MCIVLVLVLVSDDENVVSAYHTVFQTCTPRGSYSIITTVALKMPCNLVTNIQVEQKS